MTDGSKLALVVLVLILAAIVIVTRFPGLLTALVGTASARCGDGSLSFSRRRPGTCSHHGGVTEWYRPLTA
jgi:hypothetical protein